jgi:hypothetical protein
LLVTDDLRRRNPIFQARLAEAKYVHLHTLHLLHIEDQPHSTMGVILTESYDADVKKHHYIVVYMIQGGVAAAAIHVKQSEDAPEKTVAILWVSIGNTCLS